jgi:hypothetical protein
VVSAAAIRLALVASLGIPFESPRDWGEDAIIL